MPSVHKAFQCIGPVEHGITQTTRHIYIVIGCSLHQQGEVETFPRGTQVQTEINFWRVATGNWLNIVIINYAIAIEILVFQVARHHSRVAGVILDCPVIDVFLILELTYTFVTERHIIPTIAKVTGPVLIGVDWISLFNVAVFRASERHITFDRVSPVSYCICVS